MNDNLNEKGVQNRCGRVTADNSAYAKFNKFEVSKIYMTACMCIYKFCQIKKIYVHDFS